MSEPTKTQEFVAELVRLLAREGYDVESRSRRAAVEVIARIRTSEGKQAGFSYRFDTADIERYDLAPMSIAIDAAEMYRARMPEPS